MDISTKIRLALAYIKMSESELARQIGTSPQAFGQRLKTGKFTSDELDQIAAALGATYFYGFQFQDGTKI